ncbi:hypothetical protein PPL_10792 [Heterostelium album PN500]|uniref:Calponin-homology (CH) domain-containing protein n=1 Tax=Heterostelium pallidum (strain ATCC 26659 / Pp 5 / PN500) TaxID=670386 RepID=D3BS02_HETP5|nr:hypothetical protein PPL_10792 [Heterostelium album PN500]EFA75739.1 hypothetical protein PPL_10792 [Heterostelium album PN500]|eukprot:XP_020427873.1 hypothetical protein PPL_10792 [Heterostelium album PN500]
MATSSAVVNSKKWEDAQEKAFTNWVNSLLKKVGKRVDNMSTDFNDGVTFIQFLELLSNKKCKHKYNPEPKDKINKIQNLHIEWIPRWSGISGDGSEAVVRQRRIVCVVRS